MFLFITSIRHPDNCYSYQRVGRLLENTLRSVCNQTKDCFRVLVVCNRIPAIQKFTQVEYLRVDFPAPSSLNQPHTGMEAIRVDRGCKYMAGLAHARLYDPAYVMFFDADDYVTNRIVDHVVGQPEPSGWYFDEGYQYQFGDTRLTPLSDFHHHCGTSLIFPYSILNVPPGLTGKSRISKIIKATDEKYLKYVLGSHRIAVDTFKSRGYTFRPVPFAGAIWTLGNGENHSGRTGQPGIISISQKIRTEFGFDPQSLTEIPGTSHI